MSDSGDKTEITLERLYEIVEAHKPREKSLLDEESTEAYNEEAARTDFGDQFIKRLMNDQRNFKGDWWQLALLIKNLQFDIKIPEIKIVDRLQAWKSWRIIENNIEIIHLEHAYLRYAPLEHADFAFGHLEHAILFSARLEHAILDHTYFEHANLNMVHLEHANLSSAQLEHANLFATHLENACLIDSQLQHATLNQANMSRTIVRGVKGLRFDRNRVEGIDIEGNAPDPWSVLRRKYTGPMFFCHLLLLIVFFIPYAVDAFYLSSVSNFQTWLVAEYDAMESKIPDVELFHQYNAELKRRIAEDMEEISAWRLLLGLQDGFWSISFAFAFVVIVYNFLRGWLTLKVSSLRDAEERSHITPALKEYWPLFRCHQVAKYLWYAAILVVAFNTGHWLYTTTVYIPK